MTKQWSVRSLGLTACLLSSLLFLLFQGGKVAFMVFSMMAILSLYLFMGRWSGITRTQGERELNNTPGGEVEAGTALKVHLKFRVPGLWPIPYVIVRDHLRRRNGDNQLFERSFVLDWKRKGEVKYKTKPLQRGIYEFSETYCSTEDIFGLFQHDGKVNMKHTVQVLPKTIHIASWRHFNRFTRGSHHHSANINSRRETTQINGVREYVYGDRISRIHWNASARTGIWKSKEFERESLPKTMIVLDGDQNAYLTSEDFELAVSVAASILKFGYNQQFALGMLTSGENKALFEPQTEVLQQKKMMSHLIRVEMGETAALEELLGEEIIHLKQSSFIILISPRPAHSLTSVYRWMQQQELNGCHIGVGNGRQMQEQADYKNVETLQMKSYRIRHLEELPLVLGGRDR